MPDVPSGRLKPLKLETDRFTCLHSPVPHQVLHDFRCDLAVHLAGGARHPWQDWLVSLPRELEPSLFLLKVFHVLQQLQHRLFLDRECGHTLFWL
jgi:hypothetical protein